MGTSSPMSSEDRKRGSSTYTHIHMYMYDSTCIYTLYMYGYVSAGCDLLQHTCTISARG